MTEEWRPIPGWEGYYSVSDHGNVRSEDRVVFHPQGPARHRSRALTPVVKPKGYHEVALCRDSRKVTRYVHRLVLEAFVGLRPDGMECCHNDGNPANNCLENLRWDTPSENSYDRVRHGTHHKARLTHCSRCSLPYDESNTYRKPDGRRSCRNCMNRAGREYRARLREQRERVSA